MRKLLGSVVSLLLVGSGLALVGPAGLALASCEDTSDLHSFKVRMWTEKSRYRLGDVARVHVKVIREVEGRDLGPAEGAEVSVALLSQGVAAWSDAVTDTAGKALVKVRIGRHMRPGPADASARANKDVATPPCMRIQELGFQEKKDFLTIVL